MRRLHRRVPIVLGTVALGVALVVAATGKVSAQNDNVGNPSIVARLDGLRAAVVAVQEGVSALLAPAATTVRFTPLALIPPLTGGNCEVVNVTDVTRTVLIEMIGGNGVAVSQRSVVLQPGHSRVEGFFVEGYYYCKFTVMDDGGSRTDIRASIRAPRGEVLPGE